MTKQEHQHLTKIAHSDTYKIGSLLRNYLEEVKIEETVEGNYTSSQRNSAWLYMTMKVQQLNEAGLEMRKVLKPTYAIPWTKESFHDHVFIPIQKALFGTDSMKALKKLQVSKIHEVIEREFGEKHGLDYIPFPANPENEKEMLGGYKTSAGKSTIPYDDEYKEPLI